MSEVNEQNQDSQAVAETPPQTARNRRKTIVGVVTSAKMDKTRRVSIPRLAKHPKYEKYLRRQQICYVHDENNESAIGDQVEIMETRPLSKLKRWRLVRIVSQAVNPLDVGEGNESAAVAE